MAGSGSGLSFHVTQMITGHGCFGRYLWRIGRERTVQCWHCASDEDTAQHTLEECPAWIDERLVLSRIIGADLSLPAVIAEMLGIEED